MAFADPQVYTVNAVAKSMPRIKSEGFSSLYSMPDESFSLQVRHSQLTKAKKLRDKHLLAFTHRKVVTDPITTINDFDTCTVSLQIDRPNVGWTDVEIWHMIDAVKTKLLQALATQLVGRES